MVIAADDDRNDDDDDDNTDDEDDEDDDDEDDDDNDDDGECHDDTHPPTVATSIAHAATVAVAADTGGVGEHGAEKRAHRVVSVGTPPLQNRPGVCPRRRCRRCGGLHFYIFISFVASVCASFVLTHVFTVFILL